MYSKSATIPVHRLEDYTKDGFEIRRMYPDSKGKHEALVLDLHRDDHYIFILVENGKGKFMVDFEVFQLKEHSLIFVLPGQVHRYIQIEDGATGWFMALDPKLVPDSCRYVLEDPLLSERHLKPGKEDVQPLAQCMELIDFLARRKVETVYYHKTVQSLLASFSCMVAGLYAPVVGVSEEGARPQLITRQFRRMLAREYKEVKSPAVYAEKQHISLSYLNEVVKATTGFAVSHWIQQEVMMEAQRLLYFSDSSVKEVAHELGYEDHTYFSRLFRKITGRTPGAFRRRYRE